METTLDRRSERGQRYSLQVPVELGRQGQVQQVEADAVNLGRGGLSVRAAELPEVGTRMHCRFETMPGGTEIISEAEVVWTRDTAVAGEGGTFGLRFVDLEPAQAGLIEEMLAERLAHSLAGEDAPESDATLELGPSGTPIQARVARRGRRTARFEQRLDLLALGRALLVREQGHRGRQGNISGVSLRLQDGTPTLSVNVDFDSELSFGEFSWSDYDLPAGALSGDGGPDTTPDLDTPGAQAEAVRARIAGGHVTLTEFDPVLPRLIGEPSKEGGAPVGPSVAGTMDAFGLVEARAREVENQAFREEGSTPGETFGPELTVTSSVEQESPTVAETASGDEALALARQASREPSVDAMPSPEALSELDDVLVGGPGEHAASEAILRSVPEEGAADMLDTVDHDGAVEAAPESAEADIDATAVARPPITHEFSPDAMPEVPAWSRRAAALVAAAARATERTRGAIAPALEQSLSKLRALGGRFDRKRIARVGSAARRAVAPRPRRRTTAPARRQTTARYQGAPRLIALSVLGAGVVGLGVYALAPTETAVVENLHRPISAPAGQAAVTPAEAGPTPATDVATPPSVPSPASVPQASPYAVDVNAPSETPSAPSPTPGKRAPVFGKADLEGRTFELRMSAAVESMRGIADEGGFTVHIPGALSLDRAGPIAAAYPAVRRSMILNKGDHAELTIRFEKGESPAYRVRGKGKVLELTLKN